MQRRTDAQAGAHLAAWSQAQQQQKEGQGGQAGGDKRQAAAVPRGRYRPALQRRSRGMTCHGARVGCVW